MKLFRLALVLFLIFPYYAYAQEVTAVEEFDENGWTSVISYDSGGAENSVTNLYDGTYLCDGYCLEYNRNSQSGYVLRLWWSQTTVETFAVDLSGLNNDWDIKFLYTDDTDSGWLTQTFEAMEGVGWQDVEYSYTETNGKYIKEVNLNFYADYMGLDNIAITYTDNTTTTTTTSSTTSTTTTTTSTTTTTTIPPTTTTTSTTTTTTIPPTTTTTTTTIPPTTTTTTLPPAPEPEPEPPPPPEPEVIEVVLEDGSVAEYEQHEIDDGTVERDNERKKNEELYGCYLTDAAMERGDCEVIEEVIFEEVIIIEDELYEETAGRDSEGEFFEDDDLVFEMDDEYEEEILVELSEEEIIELEKQMEIDLKKLEYEEEIEIFVFEDEEKIEEYIETIIEVEEYLETLEEFEIVIIEELDEIKIKDIEIFVNDDIEEEIEDEVFVEILPIEDITEEVEEIPIEEVVNEQIESLTKEEIKEEVNEIVEVIEIEIEENLTDDEVEEKIEEYVEELETEEVIEVLEEVNDVGVQELANVTEEVQEVIQAVVEEAIENVNDLDEDQVEVVAEVLQVATDDVEIIAKAIKTDEVVAEAVEEYVERAVANADVENYTLADVTTEINFEAFTANPIEVLVDFDNITEITFSSISNDMTTDQKEKAQEVVVPVILARIAAVGSFIMRKTF